VGQRIFSASVVKLRISQKLGHSRKTSRHSTRPAPLSKHKYLESEREPVHCGLSGLLPVTMSIGLVLDIDRTRALEAAAAIGTLAERLAERALAA
jgi:hypothetical protein